MEIDNRTLLQRLQDEPDPLPARSGERIMREQNEQIEALRQRAEVAEQSGRIMEERITMLLERCEGYVGQVKAGATMIAELQNKVRDLTQLADKHFGTPCEQIRHTQEADVLQSQLRESVENANGLRHQLAEAFNDIDELKLACDNLDAQLATAREDGARMAIEAAAKVCDDEDQDFAYSGQNSNWIARQDALKDAALAIRALNPASIVKGE